MSAKKEVAADLDALSVEEKRTLLRELMRERPVPTVATAATPAPIATAATAREPAASQWLSFDNHPAYLAIKERKVLAVELGFDNPYFQVNEGLAADTTSIGGRALVNFSSY